MARFVRFLIRVLFMLNGVHRDETKFTCYGIRIVGKEVTYFQSVQKYEF